MMEHLDESELVDEIKAHIGRVMTELKFVHETCVEIEDLYLNLVEGIEVLSDMLQDESHPAAPAVHLHTDPVRTGTLKNSLEDMQVAHAELDKIFDRLLLFRSLGTAYLEHELEKLGKKSTKNH